MDKISRRSFVKKILAGGAAIGLGGTAMDRFFHTANMSWAAEKPVVGIARIKNGHVDDAVRQAVDLIGGIKSATAGKERIMLKPNLVGPNIRDVTKPDVAKALAKLMMEAGKDVCIGEGSAGAKQNFSILWGPCRTTDRNMLDDIQKEVFEKTGYADLAKTLRLPLVNLHTGDMTTVKVPDAFVFPEIQLHRSVTETDLICSVPMMKTHCFAGVTLGIKNLMGLFPGQVYGTVRSAVHKAAAKVESSGTASALIDMLRVNKPGLVVIDASTAMQGQGPSVAAGGKLVKMDLIIAGTNPLATDMVAAAVMGFEPREISTFVWAWKAGMRPSSLAEIDIRGEALTAVRQNFTKPRIIPYEKMRRFGHDC